jgi:hypothetical protein
MPRPNKGLTRRITLRTSDIERNIIKLTQRAMAESGVKLSENDTILFLIQRSTVTDPLDVPEAQTMIRMHCERCPDCTDGQPPRCAAGVHLGNAYRRVVARTEHARQAAVFAQQHAASSAAAAAVASARGGTP